MHQLSQDIIFMEQHKKHRIFNFMFALTAEDTKVQRMACSLIIFFCKQIKNKVSKRWLSLTLSHLKGILIYFLKNRATFDFDSKGRKQPKLSMESKADPNQSRRLRVFELHLKSCSNEQTDRLINGLILNFLE